MTLTFEAVLYILSFEGDTRLGPGGSLPVFGGRAADGQEDTAPRLDGGHDGGSTLPRPPLTL